MISPVESAPPVLPQGSESDILLRLVPPGASVVSAPSLGGSDEGPAGRLYKAPVERGVSTKVLMSTGVVLWRSVQSSGSCRPTSERMCEPRLGIVIQGKMRNRGLSITRGRFFSRSCGVHPMKLSRGASLRAAVLKSSMASGGAVAVVDSVAHLCADQGFVSVVAGDEIIPPLALAHVAHDVSKTERADLMERCRRWERRWFGVRSEDHGTARRASPFRRR